MLPFPLQAKYSFHINYGEFKKRYIRIYLLCNVSFFNSRLFEFSRKSYMFITFLKRFLHPDAFFCFTVPELHLSYS